MLVQKLLLMLLLLFASSCKEGPQVVLCVSMPAVNGFQCYDEKTQKYSFLWYKDSDKYIAMSPGDAQALLDYCDQKK